MSELHTLAKALRSVEGWLSLGLPMEAWRELGTLPDNLRAHPAVLVLRLATILALKGESIDVAQEPLPALAEVHVLAARAFARIGNPDHARTQLLCAIELEPSWLSKLVEHPDLAVLLALPL